MAQKTIPLNVNAPVFVPSLTSSPSISPLPPYLDHSSLHSSVAWMSPSAHGNSASNSAIYSELPRSLSSFDWPMNDDNQAGNLGLSYLHPPETYTSGLFTPPHSPRPLDSTPPSVSNFSELEMTTHTIQDFTIKMTPRQHQPGLNTNAAPYVPVYTQALQYFSSDSFITSTHEDESMLPSQEISFSTSANIRTRSVSAGYPPQSAPFAQAIARRTHSTGCVDNGEHIERHGHSPIHDILADEDWQHHHFETVLKEESQSPRGTLQSWMQPVMSRVYQVFLIYFTAGFA